jgi:plasmid stabilization system protein ParE
VRIVWGPESLNDIERLYWFLAAIDQDAAARIVQMLKHAPEKLIEYPRLGERLDAFAGREIRKLAIGRYEMRYEVLPNAVYVLRIIHGREERLT